MGKKDPGQKPAKVRHDKFHTRARSERDLSAGADPTVTFRDDKGATRGRYTDHPNYHVRRKAWMKMGQPLPEDPAERAKFLAGLKIKEKATEAEPTPAAES
jgi:hypothetical protein